LILSNNQIKLISEKKILIKDLSNNELSEFCEYANQEYRRGYPIISDQDYDFLFLKELKKRVPNHSLIEDIEPEIEGFSDEKILLPQAMLSIDKAYSYKEIIKWIERTLKSADDLNFNYSSLKFRATPKLDGFAGYDDGKKLYTRGDGKKRE